MVNVVELKKWWDIFVGEGNFTEIRILGKFQYSGYFKSFDNLCKQLEPFTNMDDEQIYFVLNQIEGSCYARPQCEKFIKSVKVSTNDNDIVRRKFLMIDCDAIRKSSTNSSDSEYNAAIQKARDIFRFLRENGFDDPIVCTSGNGAHLQIPVDLPNDEETTEIIKRFYKYLGSQFTDNQVDIDQKVYNLARLCKTYSTTAKKGANLPERPWRKAEILYIPKELKPTPIEKIKELADLLPKEEPKLTQKVNSFKERFDLEQWLNTYGIEYRKKQDGSSTKYEIKTCPWHTTHSVDNPYSSAIYQDADGKVTYTCAHSHCGDKQWKDFRLYYQPDAYDKPSYQPQQVVYIQQPKTQRPKYEIKDELPELGEKWLSLSSIKKVDLTQLEKVKTGFTELDKKIGGLYMSEVTVLSGSNSSGKSSWLNSLILNIIQQDYKVALWSGELRSDILKTWLQMVAAGAENLRQSQYDEGRYYVPDGIGQRIDQWLDGKFFLYNNGYGTKAEQILHDMKILLKANVKVFVLDNLMSLDVDLFDGDKNAKQKELILKIKDFAMNEQVHILLVAHPRKVMTFLRKNDISGTSDITNAVDNVFIIHRTNEDFIHAITDFYDVSKANQLRRYGNVLSVEKNRLYGVVDFMCGFHYDIVSRRFLNEVGENVKYGWEGTPKQVSIPLYPQPKKKDTHEDSYQNDLPWDAPDESTAPF